MTATHDQLCAIPDRVTTLEEQVARLDLWVTELLKQTAALRQQQIATAQRPETVPRDHVVPIRRGGRHSIGNLLPSCNRCNLSKAAKLLVEWRRWQAFIVPCPTFEVIGA